MLHAVAVTGQTALQVPAATTQSQFKLPPHGVFRQGPEPCGWNKSTPFLLTILGDGPALFWASLVGCMMLGSSMGLVYKSQKPAWTPT